MARYVPHLVRWNEAVRRHDEGLFDETVSTLKAITAATSVTEAINLQGAFASGVFTKTLADSNKLIDASMKLTEKTLAPITARIASAVETFGKAA
jgi:phasin family protein